MTRLAFSRHGAGPPLVLLHGIGSARQAWDPVIPGLADSFDVVAVDLPGFGESAPLPSDPFPAALAASVASLLEELGIHSPHVVGNSLGGWVALELAAVRPVASLVLLSPAGLWRDHTPLYNRISLRGSRWMTTHVPGVLSGLMRFRLARIVVLGQTHGRPARISPDYARMALRAMASGPGFARTMRATETRSYVAPRPIDAPITVAFGSRDRLLLPWQSRRVSQLPPGARVVPLPGCGHVPMADDPSQVVELITTATALAPRSGRSDSFPR
jgi:pimeloyl-ACP methyl ester carboxylesterase